MTERDPPTQWHSHPAIVVDVQVSPLIVETDPPLSAMRQGWIHQPFPMIFVGPAGTGKTYAAVQFLNSYAAENSSPWSSAYVSMVKVEDMLDDEMKENKTMSGTIRTLCNPKVLVLDDFGVERKTEFLERAIWRILEERFSKITIITTNLLSNEMLDRYGARIHSRLEWFTPVLFTGKQLRRPRF